MQSKKSKKGQITGLPFQLIFSLILIALFLYAAIFGISYFLERADQAKIGQFTVELESKVNTVWQATEMQREYSFVLPSKIKEVCFGNFKEENFDSSLCAEFELYRDRAALAGANMFFCPPSAAYKVGSPVFAKISCDDVNCLEFLENPYCIENEAGIVKIKLSKSFGKAKVELS